MQVSTRNLLGTLLVAVLTTSLIMPLEASAAKKKRKRKKQKAAQVEKEQREKAREYYNQGKEAFDKEDFENALEAFQKAYDTKPHPVVLKSVAECQAALGDTAAAVDTFEKYLADPEAAGKDSVQKRVEELKALPIEVQITSEPEGGRIDIDEADSGQVTPATIKMKAGSHEVKITVEGFEPMAKQIEVELGADNEVVADFETEGIPAVAPVESPPPVEPIESTGEEAEPPPMEEESSGPPPAFWVMAAVTGAGLVSGTVFGTMALADEEEFNDNPTNSKADAVERDAIIADVSFGVAVAAAVAGTIILIVHSRKKKESANEGGGLEVSVLPAAGKDAIGMGTTLSF